MSKFEEPQSEPLFVMVSQEDPELALAYRLAAASVDVFRRHLPLAFSHECFAKLRFRDVRACERLGEERFVFLWLFNVVFHESESMFSGEFFEVPKELEEWHRVGQRLGFDGEDMFDWMVNRAGHLHGGFTIRTARSRLPVEDRSGYDRFIGVSVYEPLPVEALERVARGDAA